MIAYSSHFLEPLSIFLQTKNPRRQYSEENLETPQFFRGNFENAMLQRAIIERVKNRRNRENNRKARVFQDAQKADDKNAALQKLVHNRSRKRRRCSTRQRCDLPHCRPFKRIFFRQSRIEKSPAVPKGATERIFDTQNANAAISSILPSASA